MTSTKKKKDNFDQGFTIAGCCADIGEFGNWGKPWVNVANKLKIKQIIKTSFLCKDY